MKEVGFACLSGLLLLLAFPSLSYDGFAWCFLLPLLAALDGQGVLKSGCLSFLAGLVFFGGIFGPIATGTVDALTPIHFILSVLYFSLYWGLWGAGLTWLQKATRFPSALVAASLWVTLEYVRAHAGFLSYPGHLLGHTMYEHPSLIQIVSLTGVYGLSFLILFVNASLADVLYSLRQRSWSRAMVSIAVPLGLVSAIVLYGDRILSVVPPGRQLAIALIQGNILPKDKWVPYGQPRILGEYSRLTHETAAGSPDLIIWPETALPGDVVNHPLLRKQVSQLAADTHAFLLVGSAEYAKFSGHPQYSRDYYNSMVLFSPDGGVEGAYRKHRLVPFAEYVPLEEWVSWPRFIGNALGGTLPGEEPHMFTVQGVPLATVICWEALFPEIFREFVQRGAQVMVTATDEAWFGKTSVPQQVLAITVFRAAENRVAIARSANSGLSALIDPFGRIIARVKGPDQEELFVQGVLTGALPVSWERTFYTQHGEVFAACSIAVAVFCLLSACVPGRFRVLALYRLPLTGVRPEACVRPREGGQV